MDRQLRHAQLPKDALFDDTLPNGVGVMEAGYREPVAVTKLRWKTGSDAEDI